MTVKRAKQRPQFALCLDNSEYPASLERWKIYPILPDADAARHGQVRVVDESGENYLYPRARFKPLRLSAALVRLFTRGPRSRSTKEWGRPA
jgi:hypothetical protein